jgi:hypothetical protein
MTTRAMAVRIDIRFGQIKSMVRKPSKANIKKKKKRSWTMFRPISKTFAGGELALFGCSVGGRDSLIFVLMEIDIQGCADSLCCRLWGIIA